MAEEGTWAGNLELQAASIQLSVNLKVYQAGQPPWIVANFPLEEVPMLHLSYHDGMHYNSVRLLDDYGTGPPEPIPLHSKLGGSDGGEYGKSTTREYSESDLRRVKDGTGCDDDALVVAALEKVRGDVDAAIEALVEELHGEQGSGGNGDGDGDGGDVNGIEQVKEESEDPFNVNADTDILRSSVSEKGVVKVELEVSRGGKGKRVRLFLHVAGEEGKQERERNKPTKEATVSEGEDGESSPRKKCTKGKKTSSKKKEKGGTSQPARNSRCPCGSTKKYKNCCGASKSARERTQNNENAIEKHTNGVSQVGVALETLYI
jgi:hypothetical protein